MSDQTSGGSASDSGAGSNQGGSAAPGAGGAAPAGPGSFHASYQIDLSNPTTDQLESIKNSIVERISRSIQQEIDDLSQVGEQKTTYDKHSSLHDSG